MLRVDDLASPLYGRVIAEVRMGRLPRKKAVELLLRGFAEVSIEISRGVIENVVNIIDGVVGWLIYFGWSYSYRVKNLEEIYSIPLLSKKAEEIRRFLAKSISEKRYRAILKIFAEGKSR